MITIKNDEEIALMRESCRLLGIVHKELKGYLRPGVSTLDVDTYGESLIRKLGGIPNFKNYNGFPAAICVSVNDEIVHGIPKADRIIKDGDIVSLDCGLIYKGYHSDAARTHAVGEVSDSVKDLIRDTEQSFWDGISKAKAGNHLYDISNAISESLLEGGYGIVRDLTGHGIGTHLHEDPVIPNYAMRRRGPKLKQGMTLAIEPMVTLGSDEVEWLDDDWTVVTADGTWAAHYENTILITDGDPEVLTLEPV
ncbi:MAG: type I methionyl aminopeptidase [Lachnospiraceae bacterium]|nr:type I methionyl aminopeptidase [Lachnospiraceae bacterium]